MKIMRIDKNGGWLENFCFEFDETLNNFASIKKKQSCRLFQPSFQ